MANEFFEPAPEQSDIVLIESATLCEAEKMIESCEHCNSAATMPFEWILHRITDSDSKTITNSDSKTKLSTLLDEDLVRPPFWTHYVLEGPARCPNCRNEVLEKTLIEAVWFRDLLKLADLGDPQAQVNLGRLYHDGLGVPQDESEAMKWYRKAADQGDSDGQVSLGWSLTFGKGNRQDDAHAIELFHKAADHGNANAMLTLGSLYANGNRVTQNYIKAYMWYSLAVSVPSLLWKDEVTEARDELAALAAKMTTEEVEEAQRVARDWHRPHRNENALCKRARTLVDANTVLLNSQSEFRLVQSLDFCYLCGRDFASGEAKSRDHVPPTAIFAVEDREPALILPTHVSCNQSRSIEDQVSAQFVGLKHGRNEDRKHNKLDVVFGQFQDGTPFAGVRNLNVRSMIKRWVAAFHAVLYREPLPQGVHWSTLPPLPQANIENEGLNKIPIPQVMLKFVELLKRNRLTGSLDRIVCRNGRSVYECVWTQFDNGKWFCAFCLNLYDWVSLGDDISFVRRGCVGSYVMPQIGIPRGATSATNLVLDIKNEFPMDPFQE